MPKKNRRPNSSYVDCPNCASRKHIRRTCLRCQFTEEEHLDPVYLPYRARLDQKYMIGRPLKRGTLSIVYKAFELTEARSRRVVAIKEYFPISLAERNEEGHISPRPGYAQDFHEGLVCLQQEAEILRSLVHDNILRCYGLINKNGTVYMVTEFCGEESLEDRCKNSFLDEETALKIISPVLNALEVSHSQGIIHCDINPSNIHLKSSDQSVLLDFGSARFLDESRNAHRRLTWNPGYSAPEQHRQKLGEYKPWTDIYACAATLYRVTSGERLPAANLRKDGDFVLPQGLSVNFSDAVTRGLSLDPYERYASIDQFRSDLKKASSVSPIGTRYDPDPTDIRIQELVLSFAPYVLIAFVFIMTAVFIYGAEDPGPFPEKTEAALIVEPSDFYILRDASESIDDRYYDIVENILRDGIRTEREGTSGEDYTSYAHFASWSTNGAATDGASPIQPAVRGDAIAETKARLREKMPSKDFLRRTDFGVLFKQILSAIRASPTGVKGRREAIVAIITDGLHDPLGNRRSCFDFTDDYSLFFDDTVKIHFRALAHEPGVHILVLLLGACRESSGGIKAKWDELAKEFAPPGQVSIISLEGYAQVRAPETEKLRSALSSAVSEAMSSIDRTSLVAIRPAVTMLSDEQRDNFDNRQEFYVDYVFQPHLCDEMVGVNVSTASLLDETGSVAAPLSVSKSYFRLFAEGSPRNGEESKETLVFRVIGNFKPDLKQAYQVHLDARSEAPDLVSVRTEGILKIEPNVKARISRERTSRLLVVTVISGIIAAIFSISLVVYWRRHNRMRQPVRRAIRNVFVKPLRYWVCGFFALGALMLVSLGLTISNAGISTFVWLSGVAVLVVLFVRSQELIKNNAVEQLSWVHVLLSCADSILVPFLSALSGILQLK